MQPDEKMSSVFLNHDKIGNIRKWVSSSTSHIVFDLILFQFTVLIQYEVVIFPSKTVYTEIAGS